MPALRQCERSPGARMGLRRGVRVPRLRLRLGLIAKRPYWLRQQSMSMAVSV
jgi:hypothetical protein